MINYNGYKDLIEKVYTHNQEHVFLYWDDLSDEERENFLKELSAVDFELLEELYQKSVHGEIEKISFKPAPYIPIAQSIEDEQKFKEASEKGKEYIRKGKTAALLVAGGQGTRLGFDGPKGMYPVGSVSKKSLFQIHAEKIKKYSEKYGVKIPWLIMTSQVNHNDTVNYFENSNYFNLDKDDIIFFTQNMIPSLSAEGKLILNSKCSISKNPDGHGGTLTALMSSGALNKLKKRGIEEISYFQVDNPLVKILDPAFIGYHIGNNSDVSSKGIVKVSPEEKVGVFVKFENGSYGIMEYSDLSEEEQNALDTDGKLLYGMGNPAIHIFNVSFIEKITSGSGLSLPYHLARKKIETYENGNTKKIDGLKFEKFIFDALTLSEKNTILETVRQEEFAPVKNAEGVDSVDSARKLMTNLYRDWLSKCEINIKSNVKNIEISPLVAVEPEDIQNNIEIPNDKAVYIDLDNT